MPMLPFVNKLSTATQVSSETEQGPEILNELKHSSSRLNSRPSSYLQVQPYRFNHGRTDHTYKAGHSLQKAPNNIKAKHTFMN
jgi:hypothetical protein